MAAIIPPPTPGAIVPPEVEWKKHVDALVALVRTAPGSVSAASLEEAAKEVALVVQQQQSPPPYQQQQQPPPQQ